MIGFYNYTVILTYLGFASGITGIALAMTGSENVFWAILCLMLSGLCDAFDGRVARTKQRTDEEKRFGIQIDSLSHVVCFGVLPVAIGYCMGMTSPLHIIVMVIYALAALIRLAYFNVREEIKKENEPKMYHGLPVTSAALLFPLCYGIKLIFPSCDIIYTIVMLLTGIAFVTDFTFKKPKFGAVLLMIAAGVIEIVLIILALYKVI